jgi:hypothetical protein
VTAIPLLTTYCLITFASKTALLRYTPQWSDEIFYWHQAATFRAAGFNGGYYTVNEQTAPIPGIHFYCHGPVYPILFGYMGRFVGWELYYAPIINIFLLTSAVAWFIIRRRPSTFQLLLIGMLLLVFWPIHLYMITNMRLVIDVSLAIVLASFFCTVINTPNALSRYDRIGFPLILFILALYLPTWGFLFLPYWLLIRKQMRMTVVQAITLAVISIVISFFLYGQMTAPYPLGFVYCLSAALSHSPLQGLELFFWHMIHNIQLYFDLHHQPLWLLLRAQMLLAILGSLFFLKKKKKEETAVQDGFFVLVSCGLLAAGTVCLYDVSDGRDFRLFAPIVFMAGLIFIEYKRYFLVVLMLAGCLWMLPDFCKKYNDFAAGVFPSDHNAIKTFSNEIAPVLQYRTSDNAWDNTVLVPQSILNNRVLLAIPSGIGISWFTSPDDLKEIKSKYLLIDKTNADSLKNRAALKYIRSTTAGELYINQRSEYEQR